MSKATDVINVCAVQLGWRAECVLALGALKNQRRCDRLFPTPQFRSSCAAALKKRMQARDERREREKDERNERSRDEERRRSRRRGRSKDWLSRAPLRPTEARVCVCLFLMIKLVSARLARNQVERAMKSSGDRYAPLRNVRWNAQSTTPTEVAQRTHQTSGAQVGSGASPSCEFREARCRRVNQTSNCCAQALSLNSKQAS